MGTVALAARLVLAAVLAAAAAAKVTDLDGFAQANRSLGVPERFVRGLRTAVPAIEAALAIGLLVTPAAQAASVLALLLFLAFTGLLGWNLRQGRRPACNCFGSTSDEPIGARTVVRNVVLSALAVVGATAGTGLPAWIGERFEGDGAARTAGVLAGALVLVGAASVALLRSQWRPPGRAHTGAGDADPPGLPVGTDVTDVIHAVRQRSGIAGDVATLVVRTDPQCGPCQALLPRLLSWQSAYAGLVDIAVLTGAVGEDDLHYDLVEHLVVDGEDLAGRLDLDVTPSAVLVGADGAIASGVAAGGIEIGQLVSTAVAEDATLVPGDPASGVVLGSGHGMLSLADLHGTMTLALFWDPWCGFCQQGLLPLLQWQESLGSTGPRLLVAGQRDEEVTRLQGFHLVGADADGSVMRLFGGEGTPSAVLVDAAGRVASDIAHGMDEVMTLAARAELLTSLSAPTAP